MATGFQISTGLQDAILLALAAELNGGKLLIYGGAVPATADASIGSATLLRTIGETTGINFEAATSNGMIVKDTSEVWSAANVATGTATFYRFVTQADDGSSSSSLPRLQGTVGLLDADLILGSTSLVNGVTDPPVSIFMVGLPTS